MKNLLIVVATLGVTACVPSTPAPPPSPLVAFDPASAEWSKGVGTATVEGQAFLKTRGGDVKYGAGNTVLLIPNVPHTFDWYARITSTNPKSAGVLDDRASALIRKTTAGGDGRFKFENVPAGPYLILTTVTWETGSSYLGTQGGFVGAPAQAVDGKTTDVIVTY